ncbi:hypothetical protein PoB_004832300 [Plakobranchus ocellatus]|uniref:Uncharacterized protein n=1 Tax=Plakobranchus ocellatus TaxID=259542 RepID=A0AAV4BQF8_9GAST|nr:hypothetical protein PoB_004832300 [Plakobranchus ocellatus]
MELKRQTEKTMLQICKEYYEKLYETKTSVPPNPLHISEEIPPFTETKVQKCLKDMCKNKARGPNEVTSGMLVSEGASAISYLRRVFNQILT